MRSTRRNAAAGAAYAFGSLVAALVHLAPPAPANVSDFTIATGASLGGYGTDCRYRASVPVNSDDTVIFYDEDSGSFAPQFAVPVDGVARAVWTPTARGTHVLHALQRHADGPDSELTVTLSVGMGIHFQDLDACLVVRQ
ncbi:hypothetical protein [Nocardia stercoris]|nr:hypothetical protein [Nocardia stercoris]